LIYYKKINFFKIIINIISYILKKKILIKIPKKNLKKNEKRHKISQNYNLSNKIQENFKIEEFKQKNKYIFFEYEDFPIFQES